MNMIKWSDRAGNAEQDILNQRILGEEWSTWGLLSYVATGSTVASSSVTLRCSPPLYWRRSVPHRCHPSGKPVVTPLASESWEGDFKGIPAIQRPEGCWKNWLTGRSCLPEKIIQTVGRSACCLRTVNWCRWSYGGHLIPASLHEVTSF